MPEPPGMRNSSALRQSLRPRQVSPAQCQPEKLFPHDRGPHPLAADMEDKQLTGAYLLIVGRQFLKERHDPIAVVFDDLVFLVIVEPATLQLESSRGLGEQGRPSLTDVVEYL